MDHNFRGRSDERRKEEEEKEEGWGGGGAGLSERIALALGIDIPQTYLINLYF